MTDHEPLRGSVQPPRPPARLLGVDEVETLVAKQEDDGDTEGEETADDGRSD